MYFKNYFISVHTVHGIGTRQAWKGDLYALRCNTTQYGIRSIHYSGVRLWNSLPTEIKESKSLPNFRKKLKSHFFIKLQIMNFWIKIKEELYVKFSGIMLDSKLSWKFHLAELSKKLARTAGLLYKIRHYASTDTLILLYHGIFVPFLSYGLSVWSLTYPSLLEPITVLQKKILRIMSFSEINAPSGPLFDRLRILKLNDMFQLQVASLSMNAPITLPLYILEIISPESTLSIGSVLANL